MCSGTPFHTITSATALMTLAEDKVNFSLFKSTNILGTARLYPSSPCWPHV